MIKAFKVLGSDFKLKIFGDGVDLKRLKKIAKGADNIEFLGRVDDETKAQLLVDVRPLLILKKKILVFLRLRRWPLVVP